MSALRKVLSIALLAVFGLPFLLPLFTLSASAEMNLPACCRRGGKHHCMMSASERAKMEGSQVAVHAPEEACPCCPATLHVPSPVAVVAALHVPMAAPQFASMQVTAKAVRAAKARQGDPFSTRGPPNFELC